MKTDEFRNRKMIDFETEKDGFKRGNRMNLR